MIEDEDYIGTALRDYGSDEIVIQQLGAEPLNAVVVDRIEGGAWVMAWVYIPDEDVRKEN